VYSEIRFFLAKFFLSFSLQDGADLLHPFEVSRLLASDGGEWTT
jgi:hypothetical protein